MNTKTLKWTIYWTLYNGQKLNTARIDSEYYTVDINEAFRAIELSRKVFYGWDGFIDERDDKYKD